MYFLDTCRNFLESWSELSCQATPHKTTTHDIISTHYLCTLTFFSQFLSWKNPDWTLCVSMNLIGCMWWLIAVEKMGGVSFKCLICRNAHSVLSKSILVQQSLSLIFSCCCTIDFDRHASRYCTKKIDPFSTLDNPNGGNVSNSWKWSPPALIYDITQQWHPFLKHKELWQTWRNECKRVRRMR